MWDPEAYLQFEKERARPFLDLLARIDRTSANVVVDLGCGAGNLTKLLRDRFAARRVIGVDNDLAMLAKARAIVSDAMWIESDARYYEPPSDTDLLISNALLQWVPNHVDLIGKHAESLKPGSTIAFQLPANFDDEHHRAIDALCLEPAFSTWTGALKRGTATYPPERYLELLHAHGYRVDAWDTTYHQILRGADAVLDWVRGTALVPVLAALPNDDKRAAFIDALRPRLADAYPARSWGTWFPFKRRFVVATRESA